MKRKHASISLALVYTLILLCFSGCKKLGQDSLDSGPATVKVSFAGIQYESDEITLDKQQSINAINPQPQTVEIPINKNPSAYLTLEEAETLHDQSSKLKLNNKKIVSTTPTQLITGVKYGILVYDGDDLIDQKVFTAGQESSTSGFALDGGKTYTFVAYSNNSSTLPIVELTTKLSTAKVTESGDLLYFKHSQTVVTGNNNLSILLKHQYSLITTIFKVGDTYQGVINAVSNAKFENTKANATIKLSDGTITYPTANTTEKNITFPAISSSGVNTLTSSTSNLLIAPSSTSTTTISIGNIAVNGISHSIPATGFQMKAGKKYDLVLKFDVPCLKNEDSSPEIHLSSSNGGGSSPNIPKTHSERNIPIEETFPNLIGNYGVTLDITALDNSFNMYINNEPLFQARHIIESRYINSGATTKTGTLTTYRTRTVYATNSDLTGNIAATAWTNWYNFSESWTSGANLPAFTNTGWTNWEAEEIELENVGTTHLLNVEFKNTGITWGSPIYNMFGDKTNPIVRVIIDKDSKISLYSRSSNSNLQLYELQPKANFTLPSGNTYYKENFITSNVTKTARPVASNYGSVTVETNVFSNVTYLSKAVQTETFTYDLSTTSPVQQIRRTATEVRFNPNVKWLNTGTNNIRVTQLPYSEPTKMDGYFYLRRKVNCTTQQPPQ